VIGEIAYLLNARFFRAPSYTLQGLFGNRVVLLTIAIAIGLQLLFTYVPFMNNCSVPSRWMPRPGCTAWQSG
jgi:magnesium-transporting ATPase (P-type)